MEKRRKENLWYKKKSEILKIPKQQFIMIDGIDNPNETNFSNKVSALYSLAYSIKILYKNMMKEAKETKIKDFTVYPLEGIWKKLEEEKLDKSKLKYTIMIKEPDFITQKNFSDALEVVKKKKPSILYDEIYFNSLEEGKSIQVLHIGSYDDEPVLFRKMEELMNKLNLVRASDYHREIYLNNKNRTSTDKLKTILRYSIK
ncbi:GyrI-like domain-containing protein [Fusobacterium nucleatum]|uniref:GyrI-like domain-containing protein n=1 Tax=Fusobacterium nucleatum TaxID=851 RepID=UPI000422D818|nr:GyrI-like domain-containing protein [Fusobacterium nucleatum]ALF23238.1 small molecule-binding protein [Fusobacterium nucleatum subsp. nucleatum ChDC F316]